MRLRKFIPLIELLEPIQFIQLVTLLFVFNFFCIFELVLQDAIHEFKYTYSTNSICENAYTSKTPSIYLNFFFL